MKIKTSELEGAALDWCVAKVVGLEVQIAANGKEITHHGRYWYSPSTDWSQGGPLIEYERVELTWNKASPAFYWCAHHRCSPYQQGPTPLVAAMRIIVRTRLGDTVDVPEELL